MQEFRAESELCQRVSIVGCPGSGKSTLAEFLSREWGLGHTELDAIYHQPDWVPLETSEFQRIVREKTPAAGRWVVCGNFGSSVGDDLRSRADCIIFLNLSRARTMKRVLQRTLWRVFRREELWNGNRERLKNMFHPNPEENIILWAFVKWKAYRDQYSRKMQDGSWAHAQVIHLQSPREVAHFMNGARRKKS